ncbi:MAG: hypothetical protein CME04_04030 [Gemmatimonadaceae bacterium]|nr:hypothetical protein [Gemmatimonadaceae bacterium]
MPAHERSYFEEVEVFWGSRQIYDIYHVRQTFFTLAQSVRTAGVLEDYETFSWGSCRFFIQPTPGHTLGHIALVAEIDGLRVGFSGDLIAAPGKVQTLYDLQYAELLEKLAALLPPPRLNLVRYHGVLAPNATDRAQIVPGPKPVEETDTGDSAAQTTPGQPQHRLAWALLLARVFQFDVTVCHRCGGKVKIVATLTDPRSIRREGVGRPTRAPPIAAARPHPQQQFDMEYSGSAA